MGHPCEELLGSYGYRRFVLSIVVPILTSSVALDRAVCLIASPGTAS